VVNYYCEVIVEHSKYPPGVYTFEEDEFNLGWGKRAKLVQMSHYVIKEYDGGRTVWIKNRSKPTPDLLTQDELKQFMWIKLKAQEFKI
jgi:hypothetical protein